MHLTIAKYGFAKFMLSNLLLVLLYLYVTAYIASALTSNAICGRLFFFLEKASATMNVT